MANKIEYKVLVAEEEGWFKSAFDPIHVEKKLNNLGAQGWDLVNIFDINHHEGRTGKVIMILKRQEGSSS